MTGGHPPTPLPAPPPCPPGWLTKPPEFVGVGSQRCGTSWWWRKIVSHPRVGVPPGGKELHYFDRYYFDPHSGEPPPDGLAADYAKHFPRPADQISGDWTPRYLSDLSSIRLLREAAPQARILVMLRDPVERYRSALARFERVRSEEGKRPRLADYSDAVWRGMYATQLENLFRHYPRDQVLVLQYERCLSKTTNQLALTFRFIGLEPPGLVNRWLTAIPRPRRRPARHPPLQPAVREDLIHRYAPEVERLARLCPEIDVSLWHNFSVRSTARR